MISMVSRAAARLGVLARSWAVLFVLLTTAFVTASLALPGAAAAQGVYGAQVQERYLYPTPGAVHCTGATVTASSSVEFTSNCVGGPYTINITPTTVVITYSSAIEWCGPLVCGQTATTQNGQSLTFTGAGDLSGATIAPGSAAVAGFSATSNTLTINWRDQAYNTGDTITINLNGAPADTTPPVITVPSDIVVTAASGASGATVTYPAPTANDAVDGSRPVTQTAGLASGANFPIGVTTNTFSSTDVAGNTSTASFTVTVNAAAPVVTGLSPSSGLPSGGTSVTITGSDFIGATAVSFGGTAAASFVVNSATQITAVSPARATGPIDVTVTTGSGTSSASGAGNDYTYLGVTGITPNTLSNGAVALRVWL